MFARERRDDFGWRDFTIGILGLGRFGGGFEWKYAVEGGVAFDAAEFKRADDGAFFAAPSERDKGIRNVDAAEVELVRIVSRIGVEQQRGVVHGEKLFFGNLVVRAQHEHGGFGFNPNLGFFEMLGGNIFKRFADGFCRIEPAFFGGVVVVDAAEDAVLGRGRTFGLRDLQDPADKVMLGQLFVWIRDQDDELLFEGGWLFLFRFGLGQLVHLLDNLAEELGLELVFLEDFSDFIDLDFWHGAANSLGSRKDTFLAYAQAKPTPAFGTAAWR